MCCVWVKIPFRHHTLIVWGVGGCRPWRLTTVMPRVAKNSAAWLVVNHVFIAPAPSYESLHAPRSFHGLSIHLALYFIKRAATS